MILSTFSSETWRNSISWNNTTLFFGHCSRVANGRESPKVGEIHQRLRELLVPGRMRPDQPRNQCLTSRIGDGMAQKLNWDLWEFSWEVIEVFAGFVSTLLVVGTAVHDLDVSFPLLSHLAPVLLSSTMTQQRFGNVKIKTKCVPDTWWLWPCQTERLGSPSLGRGTLLWVLWEAWIWTSETDLTGNRTPIDFSLAKHLYEQLHPDSDSDRKCRVVEKETEQDQRFWNEGKIQHF